MHLLKENKVGGISSLWPNMSDRQNTEKKMTTD